MIHLDGVLEIDWNTGNGSIKLPDEFNKQDALFRISAIRDWLTALNDEYIKLTKEHGQFLVTAGHIPEYQADIKLITTVLDKWQQEITAYKKPKVVRDFKVVNNNLPEEEK